MQQNPIGEKVTVQISVANGHEFSTTLFEPPDVTDAEIERRIELFLRSMSYIRIESWDWWREGDK
jgi:hypothetical protein